MGHPLPADEVRQVQPACHHLQAVGIVAEHRAEAAAGAKDRHDRCQPRQPRVPTARRGCVRGFKTCNSGVLRVREVGDAPHRDAGVVGAAAPRLLRDPTQRVCAVTRLVVQRLERAARLEPAARVLKHHDVAALREALREKCSEEAVVGRADDDRRQRRRGGLASVDRRRHHHRRRELLAVPRRYHDSVYLANAVAVRPKAVHPRNDAPEQRPAEEAPFNLPPDQGERQHHHHVARQARQERHQSSARRDPSCIRRHPSQPTQRRRRVAAHGSRRRGDARR
mmetsp:Transcript_4198/g.15482  ORF Transcript_4198/g.15482 Transcript_4198/m.15482 type:complete len:281 (+) Transcript_4198:1609-2451(+)